MARITLLPGHVWQAVADLAGLPPFPVPPAPSAKGRPQFFKGSKDLNLPGIAQPAADAALADYIANKAARDAAWTAKVEDETRERATRQDHRPPQLFPLLEVMKDELNVIRAALSPPLPPLQTGPLRAALNNKIRNP